MTDKTKIIILSVLVVLFAVRSIVTQNRLWDAQLALAEQQSTAEMLDQLNATLEKHCPSAKLEGARVRINWGEANAQVLKHMRPATLCAEWGEPCDPPCIGWDSEGSCVEFGAASND